MRILENGYTVRDLGLESINSLANLHKSSFANGWGAHDFALFLQNPHVRLLGAFQSGKGEPSAFLLVRQLVDEAEVISIAVERRHRRRGLARGLMDDVLDTLYDEGIKVLHLEVDEQNSAAVELYKDLGFEVVGVRKAYYPNRKGGAGANALLMSLPLDED